jgi:hypothetical protein
MIGRPRDVITSDTVTLYRSAGWHKKKKKEEKDKEEKKKKVEKKKA